MELPMGFVGRGSLLVAVCLSLAGCAADHPQASPPTAVTHKRQLLRQMENEMNQLVRKEKPHFDAIHQQAQDELRALPTPMRLQVVDEVLSGWGEKDEQEFVAKIDAIIAAATLQLEERLKNLDEEIQKRARHVAGDELQTEEEFTTGYAEIDDIAEATKDQAHRMADREGLQDLGYFRRGE